MNNQGLLGALNQYWSVEDKPRLYRRNTFFDDHAIVSNRDAFSIGVGVSVVATAIIVSWSLVGVLL